MKRLVFWLGLGGCSTPGGFDRQRCDDVDEPLVVQVGASNEGAFMGVVDLEAEFGPQGGMHVWIAVQVDGLGPAPWPATLDLRADELREPAGWNEVGGWVRSLTDPREPEAEGRATFTDLQLVVERWALQHPRRVTAELSDACARFGSAHLELAPR